MITPITTTSPTSADTTIYSITDTDAKSATTSPSSGTALDDAIANARPLLANGAPTKARVCVLWATAKKARDGATVGEIMAAFMALAVETGLIDATGNWGADIRESRRVTAVKMLRPSCVGRCAAGIRSKRGHWNDDQAKRIPARAT
jgi:hypothetical protein